MMDCESVKMILQDIGYVLSDNGKEFRAKPLYRDSDSNTCLRIWKDSGRWVDFKENISGSLEELVKLTLKLKSVGEAKDWVRSKGVDYSALEVEKPKALTKQVKIFDKSLLIKLLRDHSYWTSRGVCDSTVVPFQGGLARSGKMFNRYTFPIFDNKDDIIGFAGRDVTNSDNELRPKWKLIGDKSEWVYPLKVNLKDLKEQKSVILVESIGDMLALRENGIRNSIVTFGLNVSSKIIYSLIALNPEKIIIAFNNDSNNNNAGNKAAVAAKDKLLNYFDYSQILIRLPVDDNDFGDLNQTNKLKISEWLKTTNL